MDNAILTNNYIQSKLVFGIMDIQFVHTYLPMDVHL